MILKALYDYYERQKEYMPSMHMALIYFKYAILIDIDGNFKGLEPLGNEDGLPILTFRPEERTSAPVAHCMGDNGSYILGLKDVEKDSLLDLEKEFKKNSTNYETFKKDIEEIYNSLPQNKYAQAVRAFYQKYTINTILQICKDKYWSDLSKSLTKNITFRILGEDEVAAADIEIINYKISGVTNQNEESICLITGNKSKPVNTTYSTFILGGKSNAKLVAFQINSGYDSYGKKMGLNAPMSEEAEFKYTTALLTLLSKKSKNKFLVGNRTFVFWASNNNEVGKQAEESIWNMFGFDNSNEDNPNRGIEQVRKVFKSIYSGSLKTSLDDKFYILGLAPNSARISVTYWAEVPLMDFAERINNHFDNMEIVDNECKYPKPYMGLHSILSSVTLDGKISGKDPKLTPNLPEAVIKSIFQGLPYPYTLYSACLRRIRAEQQVPKEIKERIKWVDAMVCRAAIIKAYLNRLNNNEQKIEVMLDKENKNQGYLCGRLFAVLDRIQEKAKEQRSIRERYMNSASATPAMIFPTILNLSRHHEKKLESEVEKIWFEKLEQEILKKISANGFPAQLDLQDQGRFFVGYYHQRQDFFEKKTTNDENE